MRALLVPVKSFQTAKARLAGVLNPAERAELARSLAERVLRSAGNIDRYVVCDDEAVAAWASAFGAEVVWTPGLGLSGAVEAGVSELARRGVQLAVVAHADLPNCGTLDSIGTEDRVTLVPDLRRDGTNVAAVPSGAGFRFAYGSGSFSRHTAEAERLGLACDVVIDDALAADVDVPGDLAHVAGEEIARIKAAVAGTGR